MNTGAGHNTNDGTDRTEPSTPPPACSADRCDRAAYVEIVDLTDAGRDADPTGLTGTPWCRAHIPWPMDLPEAFYIRRLPGAAQSTTSAADAASALPDRHTPPSGPPDHHPPDPTHGKPHRRGR